jgi:hypothetical protein
MDPVLAPFVQAADEADAERLLGELLSTHAQPVITAVLCERMASGGRGYKREDLEDVASRVVIRLLARLRALRDRTAEDTIDSFRSYAATAAVHGYHQYLRERFPQRHRLRRRLRYLLTHDPAFVLSGEDDRLSCRLAAWPHEARPVAVAVAEALSTAEGPVPFDTLVATMAKVWGIEDGVDGEDPGALGSRETVAEDRIYLEQLWREIRALPLRQRTVLLLNLRDRDGGDVIGLLPLTGVASLRQIAEALEMDAESLAEIWNDLPLDDLAVARRLGLTRQQIINLRSAARQKLSRSLGRSPRRSGSDPARGLRHAVAPHPRTD